MALVVIGAAAFGDIAAVGAGLQIGRAVEDAQRRGAHLAREVFGRDEIGGMRHCALPGVGRAETSSRGARQSRDSCATVYRVGSRRRLRRLPPTNYLARSAK